MEDIKNNSFNHKKIFLFFLIIHFVIWSLISLIRDLLPVDALECIYWGGLYDFGTHKHPPLAGWLAYIFYNLFGKTDLSMYFLGQLFVVIGFIYLYKLGKCFLSKEQSILAVLSLEGCFTYSYMTIFDGFNPNFILFTLFPAIAYYFYKCIKINHIKYWLLLGIAVGFSFLAKYQTIMLIIPMVAYILINKNLRTNFFKQKGLYIAIAISFLIFLPHLIWLYKNDFFSLLYFAEKEQAYSLDYKTCFKFIQSPLMFLLAQLAAISGTLLIFIMTHIWFKIPFKINKNIEYEDKYFLIFMGLGPVVLQALPGLLTGNKVLGTWGYPMVYMTAILLFAFFPIKIDKKTAEYIIKWSYSAMTIIFIVMIVLFSIEKNFRSRYPYKVISNDLKEIFLKNTNKPLKYISGYIEYALPISIYDKTHPCLILDTYGHKNPWVDINDIKKSGALIVGNNPDFVKIKAKLLLPFVPDEYPIEAHNYDFKIYNKFGKERVYTMYFVIIPPDLT